MASIFSYSCEARVWLSTLTCTHLITLKSCATSLVLSLTTEAVKAMLGFHEHCCKSESKLGPVYLQTLNKINVNSGEIAALLVPAFAGERMLTLLAWPRCLPTYESRCASLRGNCSDSTIYYKIPDLSIIWHICLQFNRKKLQILFTRSGLHISLKLSNLVTRHTIRLVELFGRHPLNT